MARYYRVKTTGYTKHTFNKKLRALMDESIKMGEDGRMWPEQSEEVERFLRMALAAAQRYRSRV